MPHMPRSVVVRYYAVSVTCWAIFVLFIVVGFTEYKNMLIYVGVLVMILWLIYAAVMVWKYRSKL